jgi:hypothetical protein
MLDDIGAAFTNVFYFVCGLVVAVLVLAAAVVYLLATR